MTSKSTEVTVLQCNRATKNAVLQLTACFIFQPKKLWNMTILLGLGQQPYIPVNSAAILRTRINAKMAEING